MRPAPAPGASGRAQGLAPAEAVAPEATIRPEDLPIRPVDALCPTSYEDRQQTPAFTGQPERSTSNPGRVPHAVTARIARDGGAVAPARIARRPARARRRRQLRPRRQPALRHGLLGSGGDQGARARHRQRLHPRRRQARRQRRRAHRLPGRPGRHHRGRPALGGPARQRGPRDPLLPLLDHRGLR